MKKHFYLFSAEITFQATEDSANVVRQVTVVPCEEQKVTVRELAQAQQGVQITLFQKLGQEVPVLDVLVLTASYLGEMTEEEFTRSAEGATIVMNDDDDSSTVQ